jgi:hypothetical protein
MKKLPPIIISTIFIATQAYSNGIRKLHTGINCPKHCPEDCDNGLETKLKCTFGDSIVWDKCGCECRTCAKQLDQPCSGISPCDDVKHLYCDEQELICKNKPGRSCHVAGKVYKSGDHFTQNCKLKCTCLDGDLGCMPVFCPIDLKPNPPSCKNKQFRAIRIKDPKNKCCDKYKCVDKNSRLYSSHQKK